jgi:hypothetical protein
MSCQPEARFLSHLKNPQTQAQAAWQLELELLGLKPELRILSTGLSSKEAIAVEKVEIRARSKDSHLFNVRDIAGALDPCLGFSKTKVFTYLPTSVFEKIERKARQKGVTISEWVSAVVCNATL